MNTERLTTDEHKAASRKHECRIGYLPKLREWGKTLSLLLVLFLSCGGLRAQNVDEATAKTVAANVLNVDASQLVNRTTRLSNSSWRTLMYLFIPSNGTGFALISATDYALPVLAYSTTAVFDSLISRNSYYGIYPWLGALYTQLNLLNRGSYTASATVTAQWAQLKAGRPTATQTAISPMLTTQWGQTGDYALRTPATNTGVHCPTGSPSVAMAQVMKYYSLPQRGTGTYSYTNSNPSKGIFVNFDTVYNYANMPNQLTAGSTDAQKQAVSHLIYYAGVSVYTRYYQNYANPNSSGGSYIANALKNNFKFRQTTTYITYSSTYYTTWPTQMMKELTAGRPVIYAFGNYANFVVDGCDSWGNLHFNWGLDGMFDGYWAVGSLNPGHYNYSNTSHTAVIGIAPMSEETVNITGVPNNPTWGSVVVNNGNPTITKYETVTLQATPVRTDAYTTRFVRWSDGVTDNPRQHFATADRTFTAEFEYFDNVTITVSPNNEDWGTTTGSGIFAPFEQVTLRATPTRRHNYSTRFVRWNDGNTNNPRYYTAGNVDRFDTAIFEYIPHTQITAEPNNTDWGTVSGGGGYAPSERATLTATALPGATFAHWDDGNTDNPRTVVASGSDQHFVAVFTFAGNVDISATPNNATYGSVSGSGSYYKGDSVVLAATPAPGYTFSKWSDNSTQNPKRLEATTDLTLTAIFASGGSPVATQTPDSPVVLDDRESHQWSYYSDPSNPVRSLNPADVKITYFGYGTKTMYSSNDATPAGSPDVNVAASAVGIGIDVPDKNAYVYWKTLERRGGSTATSAEHATGPCKYHVLHNPFSIRPTYGSGDTRWRGFYKWRIRRLVGGSVFANQKRTQLLQQGDLVDADQTLWLDPAAEYGMEIEFEAIWARAFLFAPTGPMEGINDTLVTDAMRATGTNAYERNFVVLTASNISSITDGSETTMAYNVEPLTITAVYPDGTNGTNSTRLTAVPTGVKLNQHFFCMADTKFEYIFIDAPSKAFAGNGFNIVMGRGISHSSGRTYQSIRKLTGLSAIYPKRLYTLQYDIDTLHVTTKDSSIASTRIDTTIVGADTTFTYDTTWTITLGTAVIYDTTAIHRIYRIDHVEATNEYDQHDGNFVIRIESGNYKDVLPLYGGIYPRYINSDWTSNANTAAPGTGNQPTIYDNFGVSTFYSNYAVFGSDYDRSVGENYLLTVTNYLQGSYGGWLNRSDRSVGQDQYNWVVKSGNFLPGRIGYGQGGTTTFYISSVGTAYWSYASRRCIDIEGGLVPGISGGQDWSTGDYVDPADTNIWIRVRGGHIRSVIHGAGEYASAKGGRRIVITGGTINGWVAGGCNGSRTDGGELNGDAYVYIGGKARLEPSAADPYINSSKGGNVFGAGSGNSGAAGTTATVGKVNNSCVVIADSCYIARNVYGGGNYGGVIGNGSQIYLLGGTVAGKVFGGANQQSGKQVDIVMRGGQVIGGIYGGSNLLGDVHGPISVRIEGGIVGEEGCADSLGNVFGCGYGVRSEVSGNVQVIIGNQATKFPHVNNPVIHNNVYGGAFYAPYSAVGQNFSVTTWNGLIKGSVFGGGLGTTATIRGNTNVNALGTTNVRGNIYGGGNMGRVTGNTRVVIGD
ncbi:MAG: C10 family peptidase [Bacteroidales bacterium]|nr:C10 family peptidase [Bacteroidales bacterium]